MTTPSNRAYAIASGLVHYYTGKECKNGHLALRLSSNACCTECLRMHGDAHRSKPNNREKARTDSRERMRRYRADPEWVAANNARKRAIAKTPEGFRRNKSTNLKSLMGVTLEHVERVYAEQDGKCAICSRDLAGKKWCCDHDHATGLFRAVLCSGCNTAIGLFKDDTALMQSAIDYIKKHKA